MLCREREERRGEGGTRVDHNKEYVIIRRRRRRRRSGILIFE